jgi:hypothetical protein
MLMTSQPQESRSRCGADVHRIALPLIRRLRHVRSPFRVASQPPHRLQHPHRNLKPTKPSAQTCSLPRSPPQLQLVIGVGMQSSAARTLSRDPAREQSRPPSVRINQWVVVSLCLPPVSLFPVRRRPFGVALGANRHRPCLHDDLEPRAQKLRVRRKDCESNVVRTASLTPTLQPPQRKKNLSRGKKIAEPPRAIDRSSLFLSPVMLPVQVPRTVELVRPAHLQALVLDRSPTTR